MIDRSIPIYPDGESFGTHWFSDSGLVVPKKEAIKPSENDYLASSDLKNKTSNVNNCGKTQTILDGVLANEEGLVSEKVKVVVASPLEDYSEKLSGPIMKELQVATPIIERERVQSWIDKNQGPSLPLKDIASRSEQQRQQFTSSVKTVSNSDEKISTELRSLEICHHGAVSVSDAESCPSSSPTRIEETSETWENPSDAEELSSTSVSSRPRIQTRLYRWRHLTKQAELYSKEEADCQVNELEQGRSLTDLNRPRLRSQNRKQIREESSPEMNGRLRKKFRKLSSSSENYSEASSFENRSSQKSSAKSSSEISALETKLPSPIELILNSPSATTERLSTEKFPLNGTPPLEEPTSNYQTPNAEEEELITENVQETKTLRASIKRKLYEDDEVAKNTMESKRIVMDRGRRILSNVLETLQKQSDELRLVKALDIRHVEGLEICIARVLSSHQKLYPTDDLSDSDIAERVKEQF